MTMMETGRISESSSVEQNFNTFNTQDSILHLPALLSLEKGGGKTKLKWNGSLEELKLFAEKSLCLYDGAWSKVLRNGGFHCLKTSKCTLSFYPNTKTLNIQGAQQDKIKRDIIRLIEEPSNSPAHFITNKLKSGVDVAEDLFDDNEDGTENEYDQTTNTLQDPSSRIEHNGCPCQQNTKLICELLQRMAALEANLSNRNPSYTELQERVRALQEERDSLLTALRLLKEDANSLSTIKNCEKQDFNETNEGWTKVTKRKGAPSEKENNNSLPIDNVRHNANTPRDRIIIVGDSMTSHSQINLISRRNDRRCKRPRQASPKAKATETYYPCRHQQY